MHILILPSWYPAHPGDINGSFFREQALSLYKHGHQVGLIYPQLRSLRAWKSVFTGPCGVVQELDSGMPTLRSHGVAWFPRIPFASAWLWVRHGLRSYHLYVKQHGEPDLIHAHSMLNGGLLARAIHTRHGVPFVVTEHSTAYARGLIRPWQACLARRVAQSAAKRLAVSRPFCEFLEKSLGSSCGSWEAMPNIVEQKFIDTPLVKTSRDGSAFVFVNVALLTEKKGIHNLIAAFALAFGDDRSVSLKLGGDGVERPRLEALAVKLGVADRVHFLGALTREQVAHEMASADAFVLSSRYETFGVVIIEALALGKPVVATRCGGPESIVREQDGLLVPVDDVPALAHAMHRLRTHRANYQAQAIRDACVARFSETAVVQRLTHRYAQILQRQPNR